MAPCVSVSRRPAVLVCLDVTNCDSQYRRRDTERSGAAQHVSQDGLTLSALARLRSRRIEALLTLPRSVIIARH